MTPKSFPALAQKDAEALVIFLLIMAAKRMFYHPLNYPSEIVFKDITSKLNQKLSHQMNLEKNRLNYWNTQGTEWSITENLILLPTETRAN